VKKKRGTKVHGKGRGRAEGRGGDRGGRKRSCGWGNGETCSKKRDRPTKFVRKVDFWLFLRERRASVYGCGAYI